MIYNFTKPNPTVRTAAHVAAHASHMINRTGALFNYGATGTGKSYFVKQYLKLYLDQNQNQNLDQNQKSMMGKSKSK